MNALLFHVYRYVLAPSAVVLLPLAAVFNRKVRAGIRLRGERYEPLPADADPIWIHAASGEFEYAKAVVRELKTRRPEIPIVVTYFSPSFAKAVANFPGVDRAVALPLDLAAPCRSFLKRMHPRLLLIARTDLWPEMLEQCRRREIPVLLFSYTQKRFHSRFKRAFTRWTLHWVREIYCVSDVDRANLAELNLERNLEVMGDTRYDQVAYRLAHPKAIAANLHPKDDSPVFVAGSTWSEDEAVLLPALAGALRARRLRLVLVPHEPTPEHIQSLKRRLEKLDLGYALFSGQNWGDESVLLVDQVGVLAELYQWGRYAFVGGSFKKSVHSVMEALGAGCLTFVGPHYRNNREAVQFHELTFGSVKGVEVVHDREELEARMERLLDEPSTVNAYAEGLRKEFSNRLGASRRLVSNLKDLIGP